MENKWGKIEVKIQNSRKRHSRESGNLSLSNPQACIFVSVYFMALSGDSYSILLDSHHFEKLLKL